MGRYDSTTTVLTPFSPSVDSLWHSQAERSQATRSPALRRLSSQFFQSMPDITTISSYTALAWRLWTDTLSSLLGEDNISTLHAHRAYLIGHPSPPTSLTTSLLQRYSDLAHKASLTLGASHKSTLGNRLPQLPDRRPPPTPS